MNGALEFVLDIKGMTQGLHNSAAAAVKSVDNITDAIAATQRQINATASAVERMAKSMGDHIGSNVREIERLNQKLRDTERLGGYNIVRGGSARHMWSSPSASGAGAQGRWGLISDATTQLGGGGMGLATGIGTAGAALGIGALMRTTVAAEKDITGLQTFVGQKKSAAIYEQLQRDAVVTPFNTKSLLAVDAALISAGVSAEKARLDMLGLANAISATGGGNDELERMATNLQQIKNSGKATAEDIKQFSYAGINIYGLLASATGKTAAEVKDMAVTYELLTYALRKSADAGGLYYGAMARQSETIGGRISTLMDSVDIAIAKVGMSQAPAIKGLIDTFIGLANRLPAIAEQYGPAITSLVKNDLVPLVHTMIELSKWLYHNWSWLKYVAGAVVAGRLAIAALNVAVHLHTGLMALAALRTAAFGAAQVSATAAMGRTAAAFAGTATATAGYAISVNSASSAVGGLATASSASIAPLLGVAAAVGAVVLAIGKLTEAKHANMGKIAGLDGLGYKNPLTGEWQKEWSAGKEIWVKQEKPAVSLAPWAELGMTRENFFKKFPNAVGPEATDGDASLPNSMKQAMADMKRAMAESAQSITGGGGRDISIHLHSGAVQQKFVVGSMAEARGQSGEELGKVMLRYLRSAEENFA